MNRILTLIAFVVIYCFAQGQNVALNFDGSDDYVPTSYTGVTGQDPRTVEAWIRTTANCDPNNGGKQKVITDWGTMSRGNRFTFNVLWGNAIRLEVGGNGVSGKTAVNDGKWHHVAVVYNPKLTNYIRLYVDGQLDTAGALTVSLNTTSTNPLRIGMRIDNINSFDGDIDEVRVFDYVRTDSAIKADMNHTFCKIPKGLVAYYRLNDGNPGKTNTSNTSAKDHSGNGNNGKLSGFALTGSTSNWITGTSSLKGGDTKASIDTTVCDTYATPKGNKVTSTTKLTETLTNASGCDSIISIDVTVGRNFYFTRHETCDSFVTDLGRVYYQSGTYRDTLFKANALGCDSIRIMEAVVREKEQSQSSEKACDSTEILGTWYFKSANIQNTYSNRFGCDSTHSISLEVNYSNSYTIQDEVCDRFTSDLGNVYTKTGMYKEKLSKANQYGCDSIIWLDLIIHQKSRTTINIDDCDTFISPSGKAYVKDGVYEELFTSQYGCDSVMVYDVRLEEREFGSDILQGCDSIQVGSNWYATNDTVEYTWTNRNGCDSIVTYRLFVTNVNNDVEVSKHQITAKQLGAKYQWVDCKTGANIAGETSRTYRPDNSGEYAVDVTYNKCTKRSECMSVIGLSVDETRIDRTAIIYPNPNQNAFTFAIPDGVHASQLFVYTIDGKLVLNKTLNINDSHNILHDLKSGYYQVVIQTEKGPYIGKMLVQ